METRRGFLHLAGLGAASAFLMPSLSFAGAPELAARGVSIVGLVDVTRALASGSLAGNLYWFDNNTAGGSRFLGTDHLVSAVAPGAGVIWAVEAIEVETFVEILDMTGPGARLTAAVERSEYDGALRYWEGKVAADAKGDYAYDFSLNLHGRAMAIPAALTLTVA